MKKLLISLLLVSPLASFAGGFRGLTSNEKSLAVGCAVSIGVANLVKVDDPLKMGVTVCAGMLGYSLFGTEQTKELPPVEKTDPNLAEFIKESRKAIKDNHEVAKQNYSAYREVIRKMLAKHKLEVEQALEEKK
jgi:hypothetical protein